MLRFNVKMGERGQIVIPKLVRESLGITKNKTIIVELEDKTLKLFTLESKDVCQEWEDIAEKEGVDVTKEFVFGDELYEEEM